MGFGQINFNPNVSVQFPKTRGNLGGSTLQLNIGGNQITFTAGNGANQANVVYADTRSVTAGSPDVFDLTVGNTIKQPDDTTFAVFQDIVLFGFKNNGAANLTIGGGTNPVASILGATGTIILPPGAGVLLWCPAALGSAWAINSSTAKTIQAVAASGTISYDCCIGGH